MSHETGGDHWGRFTHSHQYLSPRSASLCLLLTRHSLLEFAGLFETSHLLLYSVVDNICFLERGIRFIISFVLSLKELLYEVLRAVTISATILTMILLAILIVIEAGLVLL